jgi:hypothetical protein
MATFTLPQMISRLTKGFVKVTGRMPDGLEKIKIKQEALEKIKQQDKVVDMKGNVIDTSKGIMGGEQVGMFDNIFNKMQKQMGKGNPKIVKPKKPDPEEKAMGGRIGLKLGMNRRAFLKLMGGVGAGIGALKTGLLKFAGKGAASKITKDIIKTEAVPGKPEWFDALVTKVINEGTDVTKKLATQERESVHRLNIDKFEDVTVYRNTDTGEIRVSYESPTNVGEESVDLVYKKPLPDEGDPRPSAEFYAVEPEPRVVNMDGDMEFDGENLVNSIDDLMSDTSRLKIIARGDNKPTIKEFVESKRKKDKTKAINEDPVQQAEYLEEKYGPVPDKDYDFASGGVARLLGE